MFAVMCNMEICKDWTKTIVNSTSNWPQRRNPNWVGRTKDFQRYTYLGFYNFVYLCISIGLIFNGEIYELLPWCLVNIITSYFILRNKLFRCINSLLIAHFMKPTIRTLYHYYSHILSITMFFCFPKSRELSTLSFISSCINKICFEDCGAW